MGRRTRSIHLSIAELAPLVGQEASRDCIDAEEPGEGCHRDTPGCRVEATKQVDKVQIPSGISPLLFGPIPVATASQTGFTVYELPTQEGCHTPGCGQKGLPHPLLVPSLAKALYNKGEGWWFSTSAFPQKLDQQSYCLVSLLARLSKSIGHFLVALMVTLLVVSRS